jgi:hypothetical protein
LAVGQTVRNPLLKVDSFKIRLGIATCIGNMSRHH